MIRLSRLCALSIALSVLMSSGAYGQTVFLARKALGAIKRHTSQSQGYDMATVLLQADADNVYRTAVDLLGNNPAVRITSTDRTGRAVEFTDGGRTISLKVNRIQEDTAQLIVGSPLVQGKESPVPVVVEKIARVCAQMGVACAVSNDWRSWNDDPAVNAAFVAETMGQIETGLAYPGKIRDQPPPLLQMVGKTIGS